MVFDFGLDGFSYYKPYVGISDHLLMFVSVMRGKVNKGFQGLIWLATVRAIWLTRNDILFKGENKGSRDIVILAKSLSWDWISARSLGKLNEAREI